MKKNSSERIVCSNCGATSKIVRGRYRFAESGLKNVELLGINLIKCPRCKNVDPVIPHVNELMQCLALAIAGQPYRLNGDEVRFLRKYLRMTGEQFAKLLNIDKTTLSKWENGADPVGEQSDRLIRTIALSLGEGLKERIEEIVRAFADIAEELQDFSIQIDAESRTYEYA